MNRDKSISAYRDACQVMPGGVSSPVRAYRAVGGSPPFLQRGRGARVWDIDGNEYLDYVGSWGPLILGHAHPEVERALAAAAASGWTFGAPTEAETHLARTVAEIVPGVEKVRFVNSGTEATSSAMRLARGATGRDMVVKMAGGYHGHVDALLVEAGSGALTHGQPSSAGIPEGVVKDTRIVPYNDLEAVRTALDGGKVAAVLVEPVAGNMGVVPPAPGYLEGLRELCSTHGTLLVLDEVMTGFRLARGGAQERYGVTADLVTLGKVLGGGLPLGAYAGPATLLDQVAPDGPVYQAGTLSGNPLAVAAGAKTLELLAEPGTYEQLEARGARLEEGLRRTLEDSGGKARVQRVGSMLTLFFTAEAVVDLDSATRSDTAAFGRFHAGMLEQGIHLPPSQFEGWFLSLAHTERDVDRTIEAAARVLAQLEA